MQGGYFESATVRVHPTGSVTAYTGTSPHGQGHETGFAQIVADRLGVTPDSRRGDPRRHQHRAVRQGHLRLARRSRSAARRWPGRPRRCRTRRSGSWPTSSRPRRRTSRSATAASGCEGAPGGGSMTLADVANEAYIDDGPPRGHGGRPRRALLLRPGELRLALRRPRVVVEVDAETGNVDIVRYIAVDDCGPAINPLLIDGQVHGGAVHAIGQALFEQVVYDEAGQLVTGHVRGLRAAQRGGRAGLRDRAHRDPVADQHARRQGRRRGRDDRVLAGDRQRRGRRPAPAGRHLHRHAADPDAGVAGDPGGPGVGRGPGRTEQGKALDDHGSGAAGSGPTAPGEGGGA